ncbi:MAG: fatty acid desaturase [Candidatus Kapabacteria bacterium]|nr:fatty acid desaturase [Candidatus Kapabacteria bacterium]
MLLRFKEDRRALAYMAVTTIVFVLQWTIVGFNPFLYVAYLFLSVSVTVIAHNHNHLPMFRKPLLNIFVDYWLTVFYGFPSFAWIPTHNMNHHRLNNKEGDYTITYRLTENNTLLMLLFYPSMSSYYQQKPIRDYLRNMWNGDRKKWALAAGQYLMLFVWIGAFLVLDWKKALLYVVLPQQFGLFAVLIFNYVQHVHADEMSVWNHSRNFTGWLNVVLFNNGYHTVHHEKAGSHWSKAPELHAAVAENIDPALIERSFWWYIIRAYFLAPFIPKFRTKSMRLARINHG